MGSAGQIDDQTFNADFSKEGVANLRATVKDKLNEFMGDYIDETLVEYIIVLLRNGRRKVEAENELNVFLGDYTMSFVNWLWNHLAKNLDGYIHSQESHVDQIMKMKSLTGSQNETEESEHMDSEFEKSKLSRNDASKILPLISTETHKIHHDEKKDRKSRHDERDLSLQCQSHRKRGRAAYQQLEQTEVKDNVPHQLLQFSVRTVMKDDPEAAEHMKKPKPRISVFDRISHSNNASKTLDQYMGRREAALENKEYDGIDYKAMPNHSRLSVSGDISQKSYNVKDIIHQEALKTKRTVPLEDAEARSIFVTNVHFGATIDRLAMHFNKFGRVLKVVIITDKATAQPTGSAYIEFMAKEAADSALSLDGTSFMSRILKIVKGSSRQEEAAPTMTWSHATRGSSYAPTRLPRGRGPPLRPGVRSMQWTRDSATPVTAPFRGRPQ